MNELRLRGYVTPEDFSGTETEKLQAALDFAAESDICKVVLSGEYHAERPLILPQNMYVVIEGTLYADVQNQITDNFSFEQDRIYLKGGRIVGNVCFRHARHVILEQLQVEGDLTAEFARDMRMEEVQVSGAFTLGRGCANVIAQKLKLRSALLTTVSPRQDIPGREPTLRNIALRDGSAEGAVVLEANGDFGLLNVQIDHFDTKDVKMTGVNTKGNPKLFTNITIDALHPDAWVSAHPCRGAHILEDTSI